MAVFGVTSLGWFRQNRFGKGRFTQEGLDGFPEVNQEGRCVVSQSYLLETGGYG
jgi:hypothetical protein